MVAPALERTQSLDVLLASTQDRLLPLGLREQTLPEGLAECVTDNGRMRLTAAQWGVGPKAGLLAECRMVRIVGQASEIVNTMIFPHRPEQLPTFVGEILIFGNCPRVAFVDVQVPGLEPSRRAEVVERTRALAARHAHLPAGRETPTWAVEYSTGGHVFTRPSEPVAVHQLLALYDDYLCCWGSLASEWSGRHAGAADPEAAADLARFKQHHVEQAPVRDFLAKVFGAEWAYRFLHQFLYR